MTPLTPAIQDRIATTLRTAWLRKGNQALRALAASPRQLALIAERDLLKADYDAFLASCPRE